MERLVRTGLLYDFYGGLLTEKQRRTMELYYQEDWSLAEIADQEKVSRQAVHDLLHRSAETLEDYEKRLGLLKRFLEQQAILTEMMAGIREVKQHFQPNDPEWSMMNRLEDWTKQLLDAETEE